MVAVAPDDGRDRVLGPAPGGLERGRGGERGGPDGLQRGDQRRQRRRQRLSPSAAPVDAERQACTVLARRPRREPIVPGPRAAGRGCRRPRRSARHLRPPGPAPPGGRPRGGRRWGRRVRPWIGRLPSPSPILTHADGRTPCSTGQAPEHCRVELAVELLQTLSAGTWHEVTCRIENLGPAFLVSAPPHPVHISYRWVAGSTSDEGDRTRLPQSIAPKSSLECYLGVRAPAKPGAYELRVTLVQEGVAWFDDLDPRNAWVRTVLVA